jgi:signal transduction histidine kinase
MLVLTLYLVFGQGPDAVGAPLRQLHMVLPILIWAAVRFGPHGASTAAFLTSVGAVWGTVLGLGPLGADTLHERLLVLQGFMAVASVTFLTLGAVTAERRRLFDRERTARLESERAVSVRDDFLAVASHELRTPITPLKLQLEALLRAADGLEARLRERVERALRQTERLARIAEGLLDVSRLASGHLELEPEQVDLAEIVREVVDQMQDEAARAKSPIRVATGGPETGHWDRVRSAQVISNLLSNAIKYGRGRPIDVEVLASAGWAEVVVRDEGLGIETEALERIFHRFERAASARKYAGLGLGLYVAREIARAHGGDIVVTSAPNQGSTFTLRLPRSPEDAGASLGER